MIWDAGLARLCPRGRTARSASVGKGASRSVAITLLRAMRLCPPYGSVNPMTPEMLQLVRIAHDINCDDLAVLDIKRGGLQRIVGLDRHESRQAIDEAVAHDLRHLLGKETRK